MKYFLKKYQAIALHTTTTTTNYCFDVGSQVLNFILTNLRLKCNNLFTV